MGAKNIATTKPQPNMKAVIPVEVCVCVWGGGGCNRLCVSAGEGAGGGTRKVIRDRGGGHTVSRLVAFCGTAAAAAALTCASTLLDAHRRLRHHCQG